MTETTSTTDSKILKVAVIQMAIGDEPKEYRFQRIATLLDQTRGSNLILLPELWNVGYFAFDRYQKDSEPITGPTVQLIQAKARELGAHIMGGSFIEEENGRHYNTTVLTGPTGQIIATYRKIHLFGYGSEERQLLTPGDKIGTVSTRKGTFGMTTCFDLRFPELYRRLLDDGTEMFLVASAWPHPRLEHWKIMTRARAIENQSFLAAANCTGINRGKQYCGHSVILDPFGKVLAEGGEEEAILRAEIDLREVVQARDAFPAVKSRVFK